MRRKFKEGIVCLVLLAIAGSVGWFLFGTLRTGDLSIGVFPIDRRDSPLSYWLLVTMIAWIETILAVAATAFTWSFIRGPEEPLDVESWLRPAPPFRSDAQAPLDPQV